MNNHQHENTGAKIKDFVSPERLKQIVDYARAPQTLEDKVRIYDKLATEYEVTFRTGWKVRRSHLGIFINTLFSTSMPLSRDYRHQQIEQAIKKGREYLEEMPEAAIYFAAAMGAAEEYREWTALFGGLNPEQQMAALEANEEKR
jgi:hypothetical protein